MIEADVDITKDPLAGEELHRFLRWARQSDPVVRLPFLDTEGYLVTRHDDLKHVFMDDAHFPGEAMYQVALEPLVGETFVSMEMARHDVYRHLATPAFRSRAVSRFVDDQLVPLAHEIVDGFYDRGEADLVAELARPLPSYAICRKLGLPTDDEMRLRQLAHAMFGQRDVGLTSQEAGRQIDELVMPLLTARRREPGDDVLSQLAGAEYDGIRFSDQEIVNHVKLLFAAGAGNTSDGISLLLWALMIKPEVLETAADPGARDGIVQELFRYEPTLSVLPRMAGEGAVIDGQPLPPGSWVLAAIAAANRDPSRYDEPDRFDPWRRPAELLTFGFGPKFCTGAHLARVELRAALDAIMDRLSNLRLVQAADPVGGQLRTCPSVVARWDVA